MMRRAISAQHFQKSYKKTVNGKFLGTRLWQAALLSALLTPMAPAVFAGTPYFTLMTHTPSTVDENGVELGTEQFVPPTGSASVGSGQSGMADSIGGMDFPNGSKLIGGINSGDTSVHALDISKTTSDTKIFFGGRVKEFEQYDNLSISPNGTYNGYITASDGGDRLNVIDASYLNFYGSGLTWTMSDGTIVEFAGDYSSDLGYHANQAAVSRVIKPDGEVLTYLYNRTQVRTRDPEAGYPGHPEFLISSYVSEIRSSLGWRMYGFGAYGAADHAFNNRSYVTSNLSDVGVSGFMSDILPQTNQTQGGYYTTKQHLAHGLLVSDGVRNYYIKQYVEERKRYSFDNVNQGEPTIYYDGVAANVPTEYLEEASLQAGTIVWFYYVYTEKMEILSLNGVKTTVDYYKPPNDFSDASGYYCTAMHSRQGHSIVEPLTCVKSVTRGTSVWKYTWSDTFDPVSGNGVKIVDIEDPSGKHRKVNSFQHRLLGTLITRDEDALGRVSLFEYDSYSGKLTKATQPEGNYEQYIYDARGNMTELRAYPKGGGTPRIEYASYDTVCSNLKTCNQPNWTKDVKGNQTDYTYSSFHGGILTVTAPADVAGVRPQTRYEYSQVTPKVLNDSNVLENSTPVWRLTKESSCRQASTGNPASCVGTAQEQVKLYAYNDNNVMLTSTTLKNGDGSLSATTSYGYNMRGDIIWVDGPRTDVDDKTYSTYDVSRRRKIFEIGPDPDGAGLLKRVVVKHNYDTDGREWKTETGTGNATDGSDFIVSSYVEQTYDPITGIPVKTIGGQL